VGHYVYVRTKKTKPGEPGHWSDKKKIEAVTTFLATGNLVLTGKMLNVPEETLRKWKASDWWAELTDKVQEEDNLQLSAKLNKTLEKSIEAVNDRIENGEYMYDPRTGKLRRVPARLRDLHKVSTDLIDKRMLLKKARPVERVSVENVEGRLLKLAETFATLALGKTPQEKVVNEVIEGEYEHLPPEYKEAMEKPDEIVSDVPITDVQSDSTSSGSCSSS
jgi:hypothetical protein